MKHTRRFIAPWLVLSGSIAALAGCGGGDGLPRQAISGAVTLDGQPLSQGTISFYPDDPAMADPTTGGAPISEGTYRITSDKGLVPGKYKVSISSPSGEMTNNAAPGSGANLPKERIPSQYNANSNLTAEVQSGGSNTFDYELNN